MGDCKCKKQVKGIRTCDVCRLVDGDYTEKEVKWCGLCKAWICERCWWNPVRRAKAAWLNTKLK